LPKHSYHNNNTLHKYEYRFVFHRENRACDLIREREEIRLFFMDLLELKWNHFYGTICLEKCKLLSGFYVRSRFFPLTSFLVQKKRLIHDYFFISLKTFMRQASVKAERRKACTLFPTVTITSPFVCAQNRTGGLTVHKSKF
jgi:hypothetical protein